MAETVTTKPFYLSVTFYGLLLAAISSVMGYFGKHLTEKFTMEGPATIVTVVGLLVAGYGRMKAFKPWSFLGKKRVSTSTLLLLLALGMTNMGCAGQTDQQKLVSAKNFYNSVVPVVNELVKFGYIGKGDQKTKDLIWNAQETAYKALDQATTIVNSGQKVSVQFYIDQALSSLQVLLEYKAKGMVEHKKSDPTTRPALPGGVSDGRRFILNIACYRWLSGLERSANWSRAYA